MEELYNGTKTGTTTNSYADALDWDTRNIHDKTIMLKNTGSNALDYKLLSYAIITGIDFEETAGSLEAGGIAKFALSNPYARIKLQVKSTVADSHTTYEIDYRGM